MNILFRTRFRSVRNVAVHKVREIPDLSTDVPKRSVQRTSHAADLRILGLSILKNTNTFITFTEYSAAECASVNLRIRAVRTDKWPNSSGQRISYEGSLAKGAGESVLVLLRETGSPVSD